MTDYCDKASEQAENPHTKDTFAKIANGNLPALAFLWSFWNFEHVIDDLIDGDKPVTDEEAAREIIRFIECLLFNPFVQAHKHQLFAHLVSMTNRWVTGNDWRKSNDTKKAAQADNVSCGDIDLAAHVAFLVGGWDHMRAQEYLRRYDNNSAKKE